MNKYEFAVRWFHVIAGIVWIGMLYFFNFINVPLQADLDDAGKKAANPKLLPRALWWFRWGAMMTFFAGLLLYALIYMYVPGVGFSAQGLRAPSPWLLMGMLFGTIMWFNVWFIIWPAQKQILSGKAPAEKLPAIRKKAYLASRTNTYLSAPMLMGMLAANHLNAAFTLPRAIVAIALGFLAIWMAIWHSYKVGKTI